MKNLKYVLIGAGVVGLIAVFALPFVKLGPFSATLWKMKGKGHPWIELIGFLSMAGVGGMAIAKGTVEKWMGGVAAGAGALVAIWILKEGDVRKIAGIGYWIILLCGVAGAAVGGTLAAKGDEG